MKGNVLGCSKTNLELLVLKPIMNYRLLQEYTEGVLTKK